MKTALLYCVLLLATISMPSWGFVEEKTANWSANIKQYKQEVTHLQSRLQIPGLAYVVLDGQEVIAKSAFGFAQGKTKLGFSTETQLRIASVTKSLTAVIMMQLVEEGKLELNTPVKGILVDADLAPNITLKHLLTHTSEGEPGETYVYSTGRYAILGKVIETIDKKPLEQVFRDRILRPAGMKAFDSPDLGAHAGLVSNVDEMTQYFRALVSGKLLKPASLQYLLSPSKSVGGRSLPLSLGWFAQSVQGQSLVWSFGQDDPEHSGALWLYLPKQDLTLFILANDNRLSDPFRLLMGDVTKSPFAMSFIRNFAFSDPGKPIPLSLPSSNLATEQSSRYHFNEEWESLALVDIWLEKVDDAITKLEASQSFSDANRDAVIHFAALRLTDDEIKDKALAMGQKLLVEQPNNRWILLAQCYLYQQRQRDSKAINCFNRILNLPKQNPDFLNKLFQVWSWTALAQMSMQDKPQQAKQYIQLVIDSGIGGESLQNAKQLLKELESR